MMKLRVFYAEIVRDLKETFSYRFGIASDIVVLTVLYSALLAFGSGTRLGTYYGMTGSSKSLLLLGYVFWSYSIQALSQLGTDVQSEILKGTFEIKLMAVVPVSILLLGKVISGLIISTSVIAFVVIFSKIIFGVELILSFGAIVALLITLLGMYGIGMILGGMALIVKKVNHVVFLLQLLLLFISNTITKLEVPNGIAFVSCLIPLTLGNDIGRKTISGSTTSHRDWGGLVLVSIVWLFIGIFIFKTCLKYAKKYALTSTY